MFGWLLRSLVKEKNQMHTCTLKSLSDRHIYINKGEDIDEHDSCGGSGYDGYCKLKLYFYMFYYTCTTLYVGIVYISFCFKF